MEEILIMDSTGQIFEGSQTNFYAVHQGVLVTAAEYILEGSVRSVIVQRGMREFECFIFSLFHVCQESGVAGLRQGKHSCPIYSSQCERYHGMGRGIYKQHITTYAADRRNNGC
jgi:hypothetical protein